MQRAICGVISHINAVGGLMKNIQSRACRAHIAVCDDFQMADYFYQNHRSALIRYPILHNIKTTETQKV